MEDLIERAIAAVKALPEAAQESIGKSMLDAAERHRQLNADLERGEDELDAGKGIDADVVISELKRRYGA